MADTDIFHVATDVVTVRQALDAMYAYLREYYRQTNSDDVGSLLSELPGSGTLGTRSGDPAAWSDWLLAIQRAVIPDTPEWRSEVERLIADSANMVGRTGGGTTDWYGRMLPNGRQLWACVYKGSLQCVGCNSIPRAFDPETGLAAAGYDISL